MGSWMHIRRGGIRRPWWQRLLRTIVLISVFLGMLVLVCHLIVEWSSEKYVTSDQRLVPTTRVGLLLGTSQFDYRGRPNEYYRHRIDAAIELYRSGIVERFLISGDNSVLTYNEPQMMKESLVERGIPAEHITLDYAGFDTYDSVIRAHKVFGQDSLVVISQEFQVERAVYIGRSHGIAVSGYSARDVQAWGGFKTHAREYLARTKAVFEVLVDVQPTFLGDPIVIE